MQSYIALDDEDDECLIMNEDQVRESNLVNPFKITPPEIA